MKFTLVCDESSISERYLIVGGITLPRHNHPVLSEELLALKRHLGLRDTGEIKWGKISRSYLGRYQELLNWFFTHLKANHVRFRAHVVDTASYVYKQYGEGDTEQSFYKIYFHLLKQSLRRLALEEDGSNVMILLDDKRNHYPFRLPVLKRALNSALRRDLGIPKLIANIEPRPSSGEGAEPLIQIVDVLIGAIGFVRNERIAQPNASPARVSMTKSLESLAGTRFAFDTAASAPFNIWTFDPAIALEHKARRKKENRSGT